MRPGFRLELRHSALGSLRAVVHANAIVLLEGEVFYAGCVNLMILVSHESDLPAGDVDVDRHRGAGTSDILEKDSRVNELGVVTII